MTQLHLYGEDVRQFQWFTPEWAAVELVERFFGNLTAGDLVLEPSAGRGAFLKAIPEYVPAIGVEIDPTVAEECREQTGRQVIVGDFRQVGLPDGITQAIGNPPYRVSLIEQFIARLRSIRTHIEPVYCSRSTPSRP